MALPSLPQDKANHFMYGAVGTAALALFAPVWVAAVAVVAVAIAKEVIDYRINQRHIAAGFAATHGVEWQDAAATVAGGATVLLPLIF